MDTEKKSFVDIDLMDSFPSGYPNKSFLNFVSNLVGVEGFISVAGILAPDLIVKDGGVFVKENLPILGGKMSTRFGDDRKTLERYINLLCLSDFYMLAADEASGDEFFLMKLAEIIIEFWKMYLGSVFPHKRFEVELALEGLYDEDGICITFSQLE